jgi:hypothetical protein
MQTDGGLCGFNPVIAVLHYNSGTLLGMSQSESLQRGDRPLKPTRAMNDYLEFKEQSRPCG